MELFLDALLDALIDGVKMLPFLYLAYLSYLPYPDRIVSEVNRQNHHE